MPKKPNVIKHIRKGELKKAYLKEKDGRVKERLLAILELYDGKNIRDVEKVLRRSNRTIKRWLRQWNNEGYDGLVPQFSGGPKPRIEDSEWDRIISEIEGKGMTLKDVKQYLEAERGVEYSYKMVWYVLRKKKKVHYGKPYIKNEKRPEDAEDILKKDLMSGYRVSRIQS